MNPFRFYCLNCGELIEIDQASLLFRTGFYRIDYRMGCCSSCMSPEQKSAFFLHSPESSDERPVYHLSN